MLLIHPPQVRNCEPPVALAHLAGALRQAGEPATLLDGALEGYLWLTRGKRYSDEDAQARRVYRHREDLLDQSKWGRSRDRWKRRISDIKLLASSSEAVVRSGVRISPADYDDPRLSPLRSADLLYSFQHPEENLFFPWFSRRIGELLKEKENRIIGISVNYLSQALTAMAISGWLRREHPGTRIQMGGGLINSWLKGPSADLLPPLAADEYSSGIGEEAVVRFAGREYKGPGMPWFGDLYERSERENYLAPGRILPYSASKGCSWKRCTFCSELWENNPYCPTAAETAMEQIRGLIDLHKPDLIHLCDSEINPDLMRKMIDSPPGAPWYGFSRFLPEMTDPEYCGKLAASGCRMLSLGLESGDRDVLKSLRKGIRLEMVPQMLENLRNAGILTFVYIMFGTPAENRDAAQRTWEYVTAISGNISFLNVSIFNMPVNSDEAKLYPSGDFYDGDLSLYREFEHPAGWNRGEIRNFLSRDLKRTPAIREILQRTPPVFTSNIAPFLN